jgi:hypothetical protein
MRMRSPHHIRQASLSWHNLDNFADRELEEMRISFKGGDKRALARAIQMSAVAKIPLPDWAGTAFKAAFESMESFDAKSWDDFLGGNPKGAKRLAAAKKNHRWEQIILKVLGEMPPDAPIGADFYRGLANGVRRREGGAGITEAQAKKLYNRLHKYARLPAKPRPPRHKSPAGSRNQTR